MTIDKYNDNYKSVYHYRLFQEFVDAAHSWLSDNKKKILDKNKKLALDEVKIIPIKPVDILNEIIQRTTIGSIVSLEEILRTMIMISHTIYQSEAIKSPSTVRDWLSNFISFWNFILECSHHSELIRIRFFGVSLKKQKNDEATIKLFSKPYDPRKYINPVLKDCYSQ